MERESGFGNIIKDEGMILVTKCLAFVRGGS